MDLLIKVTITEPEQRKGRRARWGTWRLSKNDCQFSLVIQSPPIFIASPEA
jgi:hypothetical protein